MYINSLKPPPIILKENSCDKQIKTNTNYSLIEEKHIKTPYSQASQRNSLQKIYPYYIYFLILIQLYFIETCFQ
jgi:hypothetical protein